MAENTKNVLGPILLETRTFEHPLDLRKLPKEFRRLRAYISRDRDTACEEEVIIKWADQVVFKSPEIHKYEEMKSKIRSLAFRLQVIDGKIELSFTEPTKGRGNERRRDSDRRSGAERRS